MKITIIGIVGIIIISTIGFIFQDFASTTLGTTFGIVSIVLFGYFIYTEWKMKRLEETRKGGKEYGEEKRRRNSKGTRNRRN